VIHRIPCNILKRTAEGSAVGTGFTNFSAFATPLLLVCWSFKTDILNKDYYSDSISPLHVPSTATMRRMIASSLYAAPALKASCLANI